MNCELVDYGVCAGCGQPLAIESMWTAGDPTYRPTYHWTLHCEANGRLGGWIAVSQPMSGLYPACHVRPMRRMTVQEALA